MQYDIERINKERRKKGLKPLQKQPGRPKKPRPPKDKLIELYVNQGYGLRKTGIKLGTSKDMIKRALKEYGIPIRTEDYWTKKKQFNRAKK